MSTFTVSGKQFILDGKPIRLISGAMHYFRIPKEYWRDRLTKLKECGFNCVETYTCWNLHEPEEGRFSFDDRLNLGAYLDIARELGLYVILRPGPYICAEWEFGGFPAWLLNYESMPLRCYDEVFFSKVERYYTALFEIVRPRLLSNGGAVIMVQIENEYGSYGNDKRYLRAIVELYRKVGVDSLLFTSDGPEEWMLCGGTLPEYLCVANFGSHPTENFRALDRFRQGQPTMCGEFWSGWFDHWGDTHHTRPASEIAECFDELLSYGNGVSSFNCYMFCGGTNFGFMNGSNYENGLQPTVTSYDYNALLTEAGDLTDRYFAARSVIEKHLGKLPPLTVRNTNKAAYGSVSMSQSAALSEALDDISSPVFRPAPVFSESLGQSYGYTLYSVSLDTPWKDEELTVGTVHDRALFYLDGKYLGEISRAAGGRKDNIRITVQRGHCAQLSILCENMGRVNYGAKLRDRKGISEVCINRQHPFGWEIRALPMDNLKKLRFRTDSRHIQIPAFFRGVFSISGKPADTFLRPKDFRRGFVSVNGRNIGRFNNDMGPQKTLFLPAPYLREGENEIILFETDGFTAEAVPIITLESEPDLG